MKEPSLAELKESLVRDLQKIPSNTRILWAKALSSGEYRQGHTQRFAFMDESGPRFCPFGVLISEYIKDAQELKWKIDDDCGLGTLYLANRGCVTSCRGILLDLGITGNVVVSVNHLNIVHEVTFSEFAKLINRSLEV